MNPLLQLLVCCDRHSDRNHVCHRAFYADSEPREGAKSLACQVSIPLLHCLGLSFFNCLLTLLWCSVAVSCFDVILTCLCPGMRWSRCHQKGRAEEAARVAATASLKSTARVGGEGTRYAKWVAMAGLQFGRPAFRRASIGWLGGLRAADYYLSMAAEDAAQSDSGQPRHQQWSTGSRRGQDRMQVEQEPTTVEHGLQSAIDVRRWSGSGQCVEAALREEVLEVSRTLMQWVATISKNRQDGARTKNAGDLGGGDTRTRAGGGEIPADQLRANTFVIPE